MATFLTVLKIIGIVLLCILAFLTLLLLMVLFVPVRYRVKGHYENDVYVKARVSYLLHIISVVATYTDDLKVVLKIFGIPFKLVPKKAKKAGAGDEDKDKKEKARKKKKGKGENDKDNPEDKDHKIGSEAEEDKEAEGKSGLEKIRAYIELLKQDETIAAWEVCKYRLGKLIKAIVPKKIRIDVIYGLDDPYRTTQIMSIYNVFYTYIGEGLHLMPVYYEKKIEADGDIKGSIMAAPVLWQAIMVLLNKDCRRFLRRFKKIGK